MCTINREASDKTKGFRLQKLRAAKKLVEYLESDISIYFCAIEFKEDIYEKISCDEGYITKFEENKLYDEQKKFTLNSDEVQNTLVSFLDQWCEHQLDPKIRFAFYTNIGYGKESKSGLFKQLDIDPPEKPIFQMLLEKTLTNTDIVNLSKIITRRYINDYTKHSKKESYIKIIKRFKITDWWDFIKCIEWQFNEPNHKELEEELYEKIRKSPLYTGKNLSDVTHILSSILELVEKSQYEEYVSKRLIHISQVELIFSQLGINNNKPFDDAFDDWIQLNCSIEEINDKRNVQEKISTVCLDYNTRKLNMLTRKVISAKNEYLSVSNERELCTFKYRIFEACEDLIFDTVEKIKKQRNIAEQYIDEQLNELYLNAIARIEDKSKDFRYCLSNEDIIRKTVLVLFDECYLAFDE